MELVGGIEPPTSSLPRMRSTPELHEQLSLHAVPQWWQWKLSAAREKRGGKLTVISILSKKISLKFHFFSLRLISASKTFEKQGIAHSPLPTHHSHNNPKWLIFIKYNEKCMIFVDFLKLFACARNIFQVFWVRALCIALSLLTPTPYETD